MFTRLLLGGALLLLLVADLPLPFSIVYPFTNGLLCRTAHAESGVRNLLDRVLGRTMPEGIVKTNGRLEATEVDVAAKYPGRLADITVEEGSEVKAGQVTRIIARIRSTAAGRTIKCGAGQRSDDRSGNADRRAQSRAHRRQSRFRADSN